MEASKRQSKKLILLVFEQLSHIFTPIINCITAASLMKSVLMLLAMSGILSEQSAFYQIFFAASDGFFFFLPFYLATAAAKEWKADIYIAMMIPATMFYPSLLELLEQENELYLFALKIPKAIYHSGVIPVLLAVGLLVWVEKLCDRLLPELIKGFLKPIICCLVVLPVTFLFLGPIGTWIGSGVAAVFMKLYNWNQVAAGVFMGTSIQPMVSVGAHWSIVPICINNITEYGYDTILPLMGAAVYGQSGAALAMGVLYKDPAKKKLAMQASFSAAVGVTEPALFGVNLPNVRPMIAACIAGAIGGGLAGAVNCRCTSFAFPSFLTSVAYIGPGFGIFLLSMVLGFVIGFLLTILQKKQILRSL